jgi:hypothetical protein
VSRDDAGTEGLGIDKLQVRAGAFLSNSRLLERPHFVDEISVDDDAVVPLRIFERRGEHVLLDVVQVVRDTGGVFPLLRPVFAKRLECDSAEHETVLRFHVLPESRNKLG